ncbi:MAG: hypothetical protein QF682_06075, partial [Candidatus Thermoplasmatota archaeon]|nr:hypothetical protein [Candidatus Thermoplasmatota archaeon]
MKRFEVFLIILILIAGSYSVIYYHDHENSKIIDDGDMEFESKTVHEKFQRRSKELRIDLIRNHQKISDTVGGFIGILDNVDFFGWSVSNIGVDSVYIQYKFDDGSEHNETMIIL